MDRAGGEPGEQDLLLYENDPIFNAVVVRITGDSVVFRETVRMPWAIPRSAKS